MTFSNSNISDSEQLKSQLSYLEKRLVNFKIVDRQGINRGKVKDIYYDSDGDLNLLLELADLNNKLGLRRVSHKDICQLNIEDKLIISNLSYQQIEDLPIYQPVPPHIKDALAESPEYNDCEMNPNLDRLEKSKPFQSTKISLLEEKLQVTRRKEKVGEVVVRKQVETRIVKIPIRKEKLIIERIGKNPERLTEIVIHEEKVNGFGYDEVENNNQLHSIRSQYLNLEQAQNILADMAHSTSTDSPKIRIEIITNNSELEQSYQDICDRFKK